MANEYNEPGWWITGVTKTNAVIADFKFVGEYVGLVVSGEWPVCWMSGPPGVGKSHASNGAVEAFRARGLEPVYSNPSRFTDVVRAYREAKGKRLIVCEEADLIFRSDKCLNMLKIATDRRSAGVYDRTNVRAPMIVTTNTPLDDLSRWPRELRPHISALFERIPPATITNDRQALWEYSCHIALTTDLLRYTPAGKSISAATVAFALDTFTRNQKALEVLSPRTLLNIAEWSHVLSPDACDARLRSMMTRGDAGERAPEIDWVPMVQEMILRRRSQRMSDLAFANRA